MQETKALMSRWRGNLGVVLERRPQCAVSREVRRRRQWASVRNIIFHWFLTAFFPPYLTHRYAESLRPYWCLYFLFCLTEDKLAIKGEWTTQLFLFFWEHSFRFLRLHFTGATRSREWSISRHISKPGWHSHQEFPALQGAQGGGIHLWAQFSSVSQFCPNFVTPWIAAY